MADDVYQESVAKLVPAGHGQGINYRVSRGSAVWQDGKQHSIVTVFMQYGDSTDFEKARSLNELAMKMPAHVLINEWSMVRDAIDRVCKE